MYFFLEGCGYALGGRTEKIAMNVFVYLPGKTASVQIPL